MSRAAAQSDLFAPATPAPTPAAEPTDVPEDFIARQRETLRVMLAEAAAAQRLPWADYTQSAQAELRFDGLARWLPPAEGAALRAAFAAELDRLYAAEPPG